MGVGGKRTAVVCVVGFVILALCAAFAAKDKEGFSVLGKLRPHIRAVRTGMPQMWWGLDEVVGRWTWGWFY